MSDAATTSWQMPAQKPDMAPGRTDEDIQTWQKLTNQVAHIAEAHDWSKAEVARRAGMPDGTFSQWYSGKYGGRLDVQNAKIASWLASVDEMQELAATIPASPDFIKTRAAAEILETLTYAQMMPEMVVITLSAGMGKTEACRHYVASRPNAYMVTISPNTKTVHGMLVELAAALDIVQHNPAKLVRAVGRRLERTGGGTLLITDEAQNLKDEAVDQLRHFVDVYSCGIALVGNDEIYARFNRNENGPSYAQIKRRIGKRLYRAKPRAADLRALIDAWGVTDQDMTSRSTSTPTRPTRWPRSARPGPRSTSSTRCARKGSRRDGRARQL